MSMITVAGTSDETVLSVIGVIRNKCSNLSNLSFVVSGADVTIDNMAVIVETV